MEAQEVLDFWFEKIGSAHWFSKNAELDEIIKKKFLETLKSASKGDFFKWRATPLGRLAEIIDQFGRYPHRNSILQRLSTFKELEFLKNHKGF